MYKKRYAKTIFAPGDLAISLADGLVKKGHGVVLFSAPGTKTKAKLIEGEKALLKGLEYEKLKRLTPKEAQIANEFYLKREYEWDLTLRAYQYAKKNLDILHSFHDFAAHYFEESTGFPTVYTLHDPLNVGKGSLELWRLKRFAHHRFVSLSWAQRRPLEKILNFVGTVYNGVDVSQFQPSFEKGEYLLYVGRLTKEKGIEEAIKVAKKTGLLLKVAGVGGKPNTLKAKVEFLGFCQKKRLVELYQKALAVLVPVLWEEPFGMVMIEAMACGTPVVGYANGAVPEVVRDGVTGFIIEAQSSKLKAQNYKIKKEGVEGMVEAIKTMKQWDNETMKQCRLACRAHVEKNFSVEKMVERYEKVYLKALDIRK